METGVALTSVQAPPLPFEEPGSWARALGEKA